MLWTGLDLPPCPVLREKHCVLLGETLDSNSEPATCVSSVCLLRPGLRLVLLMFVKATG